MNYEQVYIDNIGLIEVYYGEGHLSPHQVAAYMSSYNNHYSPLFF